MECSLALNPSQDENRELVFTILKSCVEGLAQKRKQSTSLWVQHICRNVAGTSDATGNLTEENAAGSRTTYAYDPENRLASIVFAGGTCSTYTYEGGGLRRSAFEAGGVLTTFIWDGDDYLGEYK